MRLSLCGSGCGDLLRYCIGVQVHAADVRRGHVKVKVSGVHAHNERTRSAEHVGQCQRAEWDVGARPVEGKDHLAKRERIQEI